MISRRIVIPQNEEPVFACMDDSTIKLCEIRHISAKIVASRISNDMDVINAIGAYKGQKTLVIKTIAVSPGNPINEKTGSR